MMSKKVLLFSGILLLGIGFASVATTLYINGNVNISANTEDFDVKFTRSLIDNIDKTSESISNDGKTINFTTKELQALNDKSVLDFEITNNSSVYDAEVSIECTSGEKGDYYRITKEVANSIAAKTTEQGSVEVQKIKVTTDDIEEEFTCTLNAVAKERTTKGVKVPKVNKNIVNTEEKCYKDKSVGSCTPGTEIRYMVNNTEEKTFYVLHDDGETLTLQQRENTVHNVAWYGSGSNTFDNTKGPLVGLSALEDATKNWYNVNTLNYTMGTTIFKDNAYTGCGSLSCTANAYTMGPRSSKARMLTYQEAVSLNCTESDSAPSCPVWMYNYLSNSTSHGGTVNSTDNGYWTMSATSYNIAYGFSIIGDGRIYSHGTSYTDYGARAVIEINKYL